MGIKNWWFTQIIKSNSSKSTNRQLYLVDQITKIIHCKIKPNKQIGGYKFFK
jgi:hypothetical protein